MADTVANDLGQSARRLRLNTLIGLRWLAVAGQLAALLITYFGLKFRFPIAPALVVVLVSGCINLALRWTFSPNKRLNDTSAALLLGYDVIQLSVLLYLTGGLENPFSVLFLAPVIISAVSLPTPHTLGLMALLIVMATVLAAFHLPLPWFPERPLELPILYVFGNWFALVLSAGFVAIYASRVAGEARLLADALAATELALAREQHLTQLDGLAAAAAHELGTPLATITVVVKEIGSQLPPDSPLRDDISLLAQEVKRCREILGKLTSLDEGPGGAWDSLRLTHLLDEVADPARDFGVDLTITRTGVDAEPICRRNPGIIYGLGNLIENAVDFARTEVRIIAYWDAEQVKIEISDDGPGFAADVLSRLGEPYVTTRSNRRAKTEQAPGLGLGLFVAKTLLERSGARMTMHNANPPDTGARIIIEWQRADVEYAAGAIGAVDAPESVENAQPGAV
jgi:two-component system sensor histidine kinase RegB